MSAKTVGEILDEVVPLLEKRLPLHTHDVMRYTEEQHEQMLDDHGSKIYGLTKRVDDLEDKKFNAGVTAVRYILITLGLFQLAEIGIIAIKTLGVLASV